MEDKKDIIQLFKIYKKDRRIFFKQRPEINYYDIGCNMSGFDSFLRKAIRKCEDNIFKIAYKSEKQHYNKFKKEAQEQCVLLFKDENNERNTT